MVARAANGSGSMKTLIGPESEASGRLHRTEVLKDGEVCALETHFEGGSVLATRAPAFGRASEVPAGRLGNGGVSGARRVPGSAKVENHFVLRLEGGKSNENQRKGKQTSCDHGILRSPGSRQRLVMD